MKKKILSIETKVNGKKVDALSKSPASFEQLQSVLVLSDVGTIIQISIDEIDVSFPDQKCV